MLTEEGSVALRRGRLLTKVREEKGGKGLEAHYYQRNEMSLIVVGTKDCGTCTAEGTSSSRFAPGSSWGGRNDVINQVVHLVARNRQ